MTTTTHRIPPAELSGLSGALVKRMARRKVGRVPDSLGVAWHNRRVMRFMFGLGRKAERWDACDAQLKAFAHMATASVVGCSACLDFGYYQAHHAGLDLAKARQVPVWRGSDAFTALERDVLEYAEAMAQTPTAVTDELSTRLREALGAPALVELTAFIALANLYSRMNTALGMESEGLSASCDLPPLTLATATA
ncbi:carboxymuconolactone decarboxylase family protein [Conexibacter sp. SYSU D00693]|uniref:carboxymuconolactone decarboxylase family protein n=1 Tax=Conexibacter sp. SYSU D00693 TaxID=2812560 RepID=UPI00196A8F87|nr:carboxymuconolactone decarboxylase family protein [Conexibacter sp. SYSU D00693]